MKNIIQLKNVQKKYQQTVAFQTESLVIKEQQVCALVGKNGSGKSTLLKLISGLIYPERGTVEVAGISTKKREVKKQVKFVLESGKGYYDYLTAQQNLAYFLQLNHTNEGEKKTEIAKLSTQFEFHQHWNKKVSDLSQGNRQKLSLIITLLLHPKILCLDEPTNGLDLQSKNQLILCLKKFITEEKMTLLFTTHDLYFTEKMATRLFLIHQGKIVQDENPQELLRKAAGFSYEITLTKDSYLKNSQQIKGLIKTQGENIVISTKDKKEKDWLLQQTEVINLKTEELSLEEVLNEVLIHVE